MIHTSGDRAYRDDQPTIDRETVRIFVRNRGGEILVLKWLNVPGFYSVITGGVDGGESPKQAAEREIREETGYTDVQYANTLGRFQELFWHPTKKRNQRNTTHALVYDLMSNENIGQHLEDDEALEIMRLHPEEVLTLTDTEDMSTYRLKKALGEQATRTGQWTEIT